MTKKVSKQKYFSVITKNLNWEILCLWRTFMEGVQEKPIERGGLPKKGGLE